MFLSSNEQIPSNNNPSSSSSSFIHLTNSTNELGQSNLPRFSIRDYAFSCRTKNIKKSWPFSSRSLQHCLKHGLTDPLPPIDQTPHCVLSLSHPPNITKLVQSNQTLIKTKESLDNGLLASGSKSKIQVAVTNKNPRKKKPMDKEDHSCVFAASRTCPICKTFSAASNTTLNAHMDQCLSVEQPISKLKRTRVKPREKVKLMVDIYATAKECTIEDLDKRNGTKWAVPSSYSNKLEGSNKGKKRSVLGEDASGIGPVYIDDKGQKLRILSEVTKKASDSSREHGDVSEKKFFNEVKGNKRARKRLARKKYRKEVPPRNGYCEEGRGGMETLDTSSQVQHKMNNKKMHTKCRLSRNENQKGAKKGVLGDEPSTEDEHSLSGDPFMLRGSSHVSTVSSSLNSQEDSWRTCRERQVSLNSTKGASAAKGIVKLKKALLDLSENEDDDEDTVKWDSEMTDYDDWYDNGRTDKFVLSSNPSISGEDNGYEGDDMLDKTDAEFERMFDKKTDCKLVDDTIPIPGPPGSFLPSPWDMGTNAIQNHGNSSVITSQVQSSLDQFDLTDRNSSESPVSAMSNFNMDKRPSRFRDIDQSDTTFGQKDLNFHSKYVSRVPSSSTSKPVLRLMGKDLMVINQREEEPSLEPTSQFLGLTKTQQESPCVHHLHLPYGGNNFF